MDRPQTALKPTILIAPLDWGLGHATRCIPVIQHLLRQNCRILLAAEGKIKTLLESEFPELTFLPLEGYRVHYSRSRKALPFTLAFQLPKILASIKKEKAWLEAMVKEHTIDAVISDNRFGMYHPSIPSVFITHQLRIQTPGGKLANDLLQKLNYRYINRFSECWVPDTAGEDNLGGALSHPAILPLIPVHYLGSLSRFTKTTAVPPKHLLILLSGPEPQRTLLEELLLKQLNAYNDTVVFVRGLPGHLEQINAPANVTIYNHLAKQELEQKINEASFVIARCGYSTVMDLAVLQKKSILIPTPGQTEQEYLAGYLLNKKFALCIEQQNFDLTTALNTAAVFHYQLPDINPSLQLQQVIVHFLEGLNLKRNPLSTSENLSNLPS